jgi:hypothetical protein
MIMSPQTVGACEWGKPQRYMHFEGSPESFFKAFEIGKRISGYREMPSYYSSKKRYLPTYLPITENTQLRHIHSHLTTGTSSSITLCTQQPRQQIHSSHHHRSFISSHLIPSHHPTLSCCIAAISSSKYTVSAGLAIHAVVLASLALKSLAPADRN